MIKLDKPVNAPQILQDKAEEWTNDLLGLVQKYGTYKDIPKDIKDNALKHYRHQDIKDLLFESANRKCAFCESTPEDNGYMEVEHFYPKSLYPEEAFSWDNFCLVAVNVILQKHTHDTKAEPIVNPYINNPEEHLAVDTLRLKGKDEIGIRTIDVCALKGIRLHLPYSQLLVQFLGYEDDLSDALIEYSLKNTPTTKRNQLIKIMESIERLEVLMDKKSQYSFFAQV